MIYFSGYLYTQHQMTEKKRIFRCENRNCRSKYKSLNIIFQLCLILFVFGRCHTNIQMEILIKEPSAHSHVPYPDRVHIIRLKN